MCLNDMKKDNFENHHTIIVY